METIYENKIDFDEIVPKTFDNGFFQYRVNTAIDFSFIARHTDIFFSCITITVICYQDTEIIINTPFELSGIHHIRAEKIEK